jgi:hypothetical protein
MATRREQQLAAMDATALVAELRALSDAGSSYDEQVRCCAHLYEASPLPTSGAAAEDAVRAVVAALSRGVQHAPLQQAGCSALGKLVQAAPATSAAIAGVAGVKAVVAALRAHAADAAVQLCACFALTLLALDATNRTTAGAAGGIAAVVAAMARHPADLNVAFVTPATPCAS